MALEQRWSHRKPISMDVTLYYPPMGTIPGKTRNISLEGMCVDTGGVTLPEHARVEIEFTTRAGTGMLSHRMPAYVVHNTPHGLGLMLQHVDYQDFHALRYMLNVA